MTKLSYTASTMGNWVHAILRCLDAQGVNGREIALQAGVRPIAIRNPDQRVPQPTVTALWNKAVEATGDPGFGLKVPRFVTPNTFGALGHSIFASPTLAAVFRRIVRYHAFVSSAATPDFEIDGGRARIRVIVDPNHPPADPAVDAFLSMFAYMARFLTGAWSVEPMAVRLERPEPPEPALFHKAFRCRVSFAARENVLEYSRVAVERALPDANAAISRQNDELVARELGKMDLQTLSARVLRELAETLPEGPSEADIARRLCLSERHMQRLLAVERSSYRALLDQIRGEVARTHLREGRYAIKEIAYSLGYSDAATFTRAFKRWTGCSPALYARSGKG